MKEILPTQKKYFSQQLMLWHEQSNIRILPWKQEQDPYRIWLSEIILQQTRAEQGIPYYQKFIAQYPTLKALTKAKDEDVFRLWQGLGYYNRCKNLLVTARKIMEEYKGVFPNTYDTIIALKGVGAYTAAAIASFAFGLPYAVVDGNVNRVLARYFGIEIPFDSTEGKKYFHALAQELLVKKENATYNQAIMDMGALICKPRQPQCDTCPLMKKCVAYHLNIVEDLPIKLKKTTVKTRYFSYLFFIANNKLWLRKRTEKDIWQHLYEPFLIETLQEISLQDLRKTPLLQSFNIKGLKHKGQSTQRLTHQVIHANFYSIKQSQNKASLPADGEWVLLEEINRYAFPKTLVSFLDKYYLLLEH